MRSIDANVILRYVLDDVPVQAAKARQVIDSTETLGVTAVALAEVAWTLTGPTVRIGRAVAAQVLLELLAKHNIVAAGFDKAEAQQALLLCLPPIGGAGLGDALIAASARSAGIEEIYSFDRHFARSGLTPVALD